ncbi:MAG: hypothetical protein AAGF44_01415 [Pseudomonadota bacterium]
MTDEKSPEKIDDTEMDQAQGGLARKDKANLKPGAKGLKAPAPKQMERVFDDE